MTHTVTQADREAAANLLVAREVSQVVSRDIRKGFADGHHAVQAFAAHRIASARLALEAAAAKTEALSGVLGGPGFVSAAIRQIDPSSLTENGR